MVNHDGQLLVGIGRDFAMTIRPDGFTRYGDRQGRLHMHEKYQVTAFGSARKIEKNAVGEGEPRIDFEK